MVCREGGGSYNETQNPQLHLLRSPEEDQGPSEKHLLHLFLLSVEPTDDCSRTQWP